MPTLLLQLKMLSDGCASHGARKCAPASAAAASHDGAWAARGARAVSIVATVATISAAIAIVISDLRVRLQALASPLGRRLTTPLHAAAADDAPRPIADVLVAIAFTFIAALATTTETSAAIHARKIGIVVVAARVFVAPVVVRAATYNTSRPSSHGPAACRYHSHGSVVFFHCATRRAARHTAPAFEARQGRHMRSA